MVAVSGCGVLPGNTHAYSGRVQGDSAACAQPSPYNFGSQVRLTDGDFNRLPTALAIAPDGRIFWTRRDGQLNVIEDGGSQVFASVETTTIGERGLVGLALSPDFATDHYVYAFYTRKDDLTASRVVRWEDCGGTGTHEITIVDNLPAGVNSNIHKSGRLAFGPDGDLYVSVGDNLNHVDAQDTSVLSGKILRFKPDGSVPPDNPFGPDNPVWAYGFRNVFGMAFNPAGTLGATNNGPNDDFGNTCNSCGDEFITVVKGGGYQWGNCWGYSNPTILPSPTPTPKKGSKPVVATPSCGFDAYLNSPQLEPDYSTELVKPRFTAPTGVTWVDDQGPPTLRNHFVFCTFSNYGIGVRPGEMWIFNGRRDAVDTHIEGCTYDVKQGPDHALYFLDASTLTRYTG